MASVPLSCARDGLKPKTIVIPALTTAEKDIAITCENTESFDVDTVVHEIREAVKVVKVVY